MSTLHHSLRALCLGAAAILCARGARAQITLPVNPLTLIRGEQPAGEGVAEGRYLAMELEAKLLADPLVAGSQPSLELGPDGWILKGQFNNQAGRMRAREIVADATGSQPRDKSRVVIYATTPPKPLSPAATKVMAQRLIREKFQNLSASVRCDSENPGVVQLNGTALCVEDKLELLRAVHRQKGVVAVENEIVLSPMIRNGKRVILVSQTGDLALDSLPTSFRADGGPSETPAQPAAVPARSPAAEQPLPPLPPEVPPPPKGLSRDEALIPAGSSSPENKIVTEAPKPEASPSAGGSFIARGLPEEVESASPTVRPLVRAIPEESEPARPQVRAKTGMLHHPGRAWAGPAAVKVGGQPIATLRDLNQSSGVQWVTAHQPTRSRAAELAWLERVQPKALPTPEAALAGGNAAPKASASQTVVVASKKVVAAPTMVAPQTMTVVHPAGAAGGFAARGISDTQTLDKEKVGSDAGTIQPVRATLLLDEEVKPSALNQPAGAKPNLAHLESAVRIACAGLVQKVEIEERGGITLVRVTANDTTSERKALEALVLLPEIHHPGVKLETKLSR
jgi:hypothetical protein